MTCRRSSPFGWSGLWLATLLLALGLFGPGRAGAQVLESRTYGVYFSSGMTGTTLSDTITGNETVVYRLSARSGQTMTASLSGPNPSVFFIVYGPGQMPGGRSIASSDKAGSLVPSVNRFQARLLSTGDYRIEVRLNRSAASRGERAAFSLSLSVGDGAVQLPGGGSTGADANLTSQYLRVTGVASNDRLNVRGGPSTGFEVRFTLRNGEIIRNLGCTPQVADMVWCRVHRISDPSTPGWAAARYLEASQPPGSGATQLPGTVPAPGGGATQLPGDALVPGTNYHATGRLTCTIQGRGYQCSFGVIRRGGGSGSLDVTMPAGTQRRIEFLAGRPVSSNSPAGIYAEWAGGDVIVSVGTNERYVVPNAILFGG